MRRLKQLEDERDSLAQGLICAQNAVEWYQKQLTQVNSKLNGHGINVSIKKHIPFATDNTSIIVS